MSRIRNCAQAELSTGTSACPMDLKRIIGAILVEPGTVLPADLTPQKFEQLCHEDLPNRIYPLFTFVNFAPNGGEVQTASNGYGPMKATGLSARNDAFTLDHSDEALTASLLKCLNKPYDVYYIDEGQFIYGYDEGDGVLHGIPMASVYPNNPVFSSTEGAEMLIYFCYKDIRDMLEHLQYQKLDFDPARCSKGLINVVLKEMSPGKYKVIEEIGGYDRTVEFGEAIQTAAESVVLNGSAVTYENGLINITSEGTPSLAAPSVLYKAEIKGIQYSRTEKLVV